MNISIVIPAYNEERRIEPSLKYIISYLKKHFDKYEIIIVDDGSNDRTHEIISRYKNNNVKILRNELNKGKGYSVRRGILTAQYPLVLFSDSDLATPIEELGDFTRYINNHNYDVVIASRNLKNSNIKNNQPLYRQVLEKFSPE